VKCAGGIGYRCEGCSTRLGFYGPLSKEAQHLVRKNAANHAEETGHAVALDLGRNTNRLGGERA